MMIPDGSHPAATVAKGSSFYLAMRLLPRQQRDAMYAVYNVCRAIDDVADEGGSFAQRLTELQQWRDDLRSLYSGGPPGRFAPVAPVVRQFGLQERDFEALIDGMTMDAAEDIRAPDMGTLDLYCDRVASAVGRLSNKIFGVPDGKGVTLAHHLGRALQLTNILRDLDEDAALGRLYLPREALEEAGVAWRAPAEAVAHPAVDQACLAVVDKARRHFNEAAAIVRDLPRSATRAPRLMAGVYAELLDALVARGFAAPRIRVRIGRMRLIKVALQQGLL